MFGAPLRVGKYPPGSSTEDIDALDLALRQLGVGSERAWMAGDGIQDLRAGRAAGLHTIGALYGFHGAKPLQGASFDHPANGR